MFIHNWNANEDNNNSRNTNEDNNSNGNAKFNLDEILITPIFIIYNEIINSVYLIEYT